MNKRIIILIGILGIAIVVFLLINNESKNSITNTSTEQKQVVQDEYIVDPSDMYKLAALDEAVTADTLTEREKYWLIHMREEEKLAMDVYSTLGDKWGMRIFSNIASSEQTHTNAVKTLLERYGIPDPVTNDAVGVFSLPEMQTLYNDLVKKGNQSLAQALVVGATIEDLDISDLDMAMAETDKAEIDIVYANLQKGSRNHMRAFVKNLNQRGEVYTPQYISVNEYQAIISAQQERGRVQ